MHEKYGAPFHDSGFFLFEKGDVNGENAQKTYQILRSRSSLHNKETGKTAEIPWNFAKFLVDADGNVIEYFDPKTPPLAIKPKIEDLLSKARHGIRDKIDVLEEDKIAAKWEAAQKAAAATKKSEL